ncbi:LysR family transcriptional regulator [Streptococcus agalactiae]|nr:LysR family transcriptional regulator [Streptococcus agalactiae]ANI27046.1 LysR family transcriptional regulator [Streptococcus agalactiae]APO41479.1 LysR family transcriptional regulator [Streptococcus agalactiae]AUO80187.1 LysR family transcriptional regulator [Streptococcus agalactiae]AUO81770.1 LysR family transcriptional regulator [Streptococcus agalactiae]
MDIRQLTYFIAVAEAKNYSHAAKSLFVTQPTLSQSIKKLEAELNTILFLQNGRQLALTEAGEILYEKGQLLMTNFNQMVTEIQQLNQEKKEGIRVGLTSLFAIQFMKQISTFMATHSNVEVSLIQDGSRKLQELLAKGKIDIGLLSFPSTRNDITIEPLQTSTKGYPEIELNDLRDYKVASLNEHYMLGEMLPRKCRALGFDPHIVFKHNDWEILIHSLQDLNAVTILPSEFESISQVQDLCWVPLKDKNNFYPIGIAYRNDTSFSPMIEEFLSLLKTN